MCGISGIILKDKGVFPREDLVRMTRLMSHRGPDDEGFFFGNGVGLGHRRLSIIDLSAGHQPVFNEDKTVSVVFNGEIYNFNEIRDGLVKKGHRFLTRSDTEVIVHAYEEYGKGCLERFRGMFAFAVYDSKKDACLIARDRLGKKPLYYHDGADAFVFASEIKPILSTPYASAEAEEAAIDFFLTLNYVPAPMTLFKGIKKLAPGGYIWIEKNRVEMGSYWVIEDSFKQGNPDHDAARKGLKDLLFESVRLRMISDVPVGVFLSGGLDSSLIAAIMSRCSNGPVKTYSVGYEEKESSELHYAARVAAHLKSDHHEHILRHEDFLSSMDLLLNHLEEPLGEYAPLALFRLSSLARQKVTVMLSGEGSDEVLGGYPLYSKAARLRRLGLLSPLFDTKTAIRLLRLMPEKIVKYGDWIRRPFPKGYHSVSCGVTETMRQRMYTDGFLSGTGRAVERFFEDYQARMRDKSVICQMQLVDTRFWLPDHLLMRADKMTMAASIELRTPFLDHRLVEFALSLPDRFKINRGTQKFLLKEVAEEFLPAEIIHRKKMGFPLPIARWFKGELHSIVSDIVLDPGASIHRYIKKAYLEDILKRHRKGPEDLSGQIFKAVALELWFRMFIKGKGDVPETGELRLPSRAVR